MNILEISTADIGGGAEKIAFDLHNSYLDLGINSVLLVKNKFSSNPTVIEIPPTKWFKLWQGLDQRAWASTRKGAYRFHQLIESIKSPFLVYSRFKGKENFHFPESKRMVNKYGKNVDLIHMHNLHNNFFDLKQIPNLSRITPLVLTLHDEYLYTGHCASTFDCERWQIGCG